MRIKKFFEPEIIFIFSYIFFLLSAFISYRVVQIRRFLISAFEEPTAYAYALTIFGLFMILIFIKTGKKIELKKEYKGFILLLVFIFAFFSVYLTLKIGYFLSFLIAFAYIALLYSISERLDLGIAAVFSAFLAFLSAFLSFYFSGSGFINPELRGEIAVSIYRAAFHGFAVFSSALAVAFFKRKRAFSLISLLSIIAIFSGFKSDAIAIILSSAIAALLLEKISIRELAVAALSIFLILTIASSYIALKTYAVWKIPPYLYPLYRFGFTFSVFSRIVSISMPLGYLRGKAIKDTTQHIVSIAVLNYEKPHIITSTLFGPLTLDFGIFGIILASLFIGLYLGLMSRRRNKLGIALYSMAIVHVLILIEVGLQLASILFLLSMLYLSLSE